MRCALLRTVAGFAILGALAAPAAAQDRLWIRQFGTGTGDWARALCPDGAGGAFLAGWTEGSLGGPWAGDYDAWLARHDSAGNQTWIRQFGTSAWDRALALCPDGAGGAFVAGDTEGSLGGPRAGSTDIWLARYDSAGNRTWIRQFGSTAVDWALAVCPDGAGGAFVAGGIGGSRVWLARYDSAGNQTWIRQFGTGTADWAMDLCPDGAGGAFVAGETQGSLGGPFAGAVDAWLARYDSGGNRTWIRQFGTSAYDFANALCLDGAGGTFFAGSTGGSLGGPNAGMQDAWLARYDSAGNRTWIRQFGTSFADSADALCPDSAGGAFVAGFTDGSLAGPHAGDYDAWLARYDSGGNRAWIRQFGTSTGEEAFALCPDGAGGAFVAGWTGGSLGGPNAGGQDAWLARYGVACYADCDPSTGPGILDIFDFLCFGNRYDQRDPYACDCDTSTGPLVCDIFDFLCFQNAFAAGCP